MYSRRSFLHLFGATAIVAVGESHHQPRKRHEMTLSTSNPVRATVQANGVNAGDPSTIIVDGSATPITANGLAGYLPVTGDRLLVQAVGEQVEVIQFLSKAYIVGQTVKTGASGARWEILAGANSNQILGYSGIPGEVVPAGVVTGANPLSGAPSLMLNAPEYSGSYGSELHLNEDGTVDLVVSNTHGVHPGSLNLFNRGNPIKGVDFGGGSVTLTGVASASVSVAHGLGVVPAAVLVSVGGSTSFFLVSSGGVTASAFNVIAYTRTGATTTGTVPFSWLAIA